MAPPPSFPKGQGEADPEPAAASAAELPPPNERLALFQTGEDGTRATFFDVVIDGLDGCLDGRIPALEAALRGEGEMGDVSGQIQACAMLAAWGHADALDLACLWAADPGGAPWAAGDGASPAPAVRDRHTGSDAALEVLAEAVGLTASCDRELPPGGIDGPVLRALAAMLSVSHRFHFADALAGALRRVPGAAEALAPEIDRALGEAVRAARAAAAAAGEGGGRCEGDGDGPSPLPDFDLGYQTAQLLRVLAPVRDGAAAGHATDLLDLYRDVPRTAREVVAALRGGTGPATAALLGGMMAAAAGEGREGGGEGGAPAGTEGVLRAALSHRGLLGGEGGAGGGGVDDVNGNRDGDGDGEERIPLVRLLPLTGAVPSRAASARAIGEGRVAVDGMATEDRGLLVLPGRSSVTLDGVPVEMNMAGAGKGTGERGRMPGGAPPGGPAHVHVLLHKPAGCLCTRGNLRQAVGGGKVGDGRPTVYGLVREQLFGGGSGSGGGVPHCVPVGRLDADTTGLLLLTSDGVLNNALANRNHGVGKLYRARLRDRTRPLSADAVRHLEEGIELRPGGGRPAVLVHGEASNVPGMVGTVLVRVSGGYKRQVRRMLREVGRPLEELHRLEFATLRLDPVELPEGRCRFLTVTEVEGLYAVAREGTGRGTEERRSANLLARAPASIISAPHT